VHCTLIFLFTYSAYSLCLKNTTFQLALTLSNLNRFSKFFHHWKWYEIFYKVTNVDNIIVRCHIPWRGWTTHSSLTCCTLRLSTMFTEAPFESLPTTHPPSELYSVNFLKKFIFSCGALASVRLIAMHFFRCLLFQLWAWLRPKSNWINREWERERESRTCWSFSLVRFKYTVKVILFLRITQIFHYYYYFIEKKCLFNCFTNFWVNSDLMQGEGADTVTLH